MVVISLSVGEWVGGVHRCVGVGMVLSIPLSLWVGGWVGVGGCRDVCVGMFVCVCVQERERGSGWPFLGAMTDTTTRRVDSSNEQQRRRGGAAGPASSSARRACRARAPSCWPI